MENYKIVEQKLESFIRKFYYNELIKGGILFLSFGLLYFFIIVFLEYFFWLTSFGRTFLFWAFIAVEIALLFKFILHPILKLFKLSKGINFYNASTMIGEHFPKVSDKLTNILQLKEAGRDSDLIIAGIEQKAQEIKPIPFEIAIDFKTNLSYSKYLFFPILILLIVWMSGSLTNFTDSYKRVVDYKTAYEPPAPFSFLINENQLEVEAGKALNLQVLIEGELLPDKAQIEVDGQAYLLKKNAPNHFEYAFQNLQEETTFRIFSNQVKSRPYTIKIVDVPRISNFEMKLNYPAYTGLSNETLSGSGNATIPEGTQVTWRIKTSHTNQLQFTLNDSLHDTQKPENQLFVFQQQIKQNTNYQLATSNQHRTNYEKLNYQLQVVKDEFPKLSVQSKKDSLQNELTYFKAKASDDYGLTSAHLVYYPSSDESIKKRVSIPIPKDTYAEFLYTFPNSNLELSPGIAYTYYFEIADNDQINGNKRSTSQRFNFRKKTAKEERDDKLKEQAESLKGMQDSMEKLKEDDKDLQEIEQLQKEQSSMSFSDKKKLENFLKRQQQQREQMKRFSKEIKENLKEFKPEQDNQRKQDLIDRLDENEQRLEENEDLLKELEDLKDKIDEDGFKEKLDEFSNDKQKQERTLEQLLELTKRFYVENKAEQLTEKLQDLAEELEKLATDEENNNAENQSKINEAFEELKEELDQLNEQNEALKDPLDLFRDEDGEDEISEDLQDILDKLQDDSNTSDADSDATDEDKQDAQDGDAESEESQGQPEEDSDQDAEDGETESGDDADEASPQQPSDSPSDKQKSTSQKMKEMAEKMGMSMMMGGEQQAQEDMEMLRQILDNLVTFSFQQEDLMNTLSNSSNNNPAFANKLRQQAELRENFKHIDDSLYALALRNEMISEQITTKLSDISFNIEKSLERLSDNQVRLAGSNQQFTMTYANDLANLLDDALDNMQDQLSGGSGSGSSGEGSEGDQPGDQLSDIIKSHDELKEQMQKQLGESGGDENGQEGDDGDSSEGDESGEGEGSSGDGGDQNASDGEGGEEGKEGDSLGDEGDQEAEMSSGQLYEIYKQQQDLKNQLEDRIKQLGLDDDSRNLSKSLEKLEQELLMKGLSSDVLKQMEEVKHQLLKLEEAAQKQGQDEEREAETNLNDYDTPALEDLDRAKEYFNTTELLNRQQLPLQTKYKNLIKLYFDERTN